MNQWWLRLRPIGRILGQHEVVYTNSNDLEEENTRFND